MTDRFSELTIEERERLLAMAQAAKLRTTSGVSAGIPVAEASERGVLSFAQRRLWFLTRFDGVSAAYHMPFGLRLDGELDRAALRLALDRLVARHEVLRTTFPSMDGEAVQLAADPAESVFTLLEHDLLGHLDAQAELARIIDEATVAPFDLEHGPLVRGRLIRESERSHVLLITLHHIVFDGWSMGVLLHDLAALYAAAREGGADPLPPLRIQYADYAAWQRHWVKGEVLARQGQYWKETLHDAPVLLELPADRARPAQQNLSGAAVEIDLGPDLSRKLKALSLRNGTTLYMTLLASWASLLARLAGRHEVMIGTPVANRHHAGLENLIGFFVNTLPLRIDVSGSPTVGELLARVKSTVLAAQQHQDIPFERIVDIAQPSRSLAHNPLFQVLFTWQDASSATGGDFAGLRVTPAPRAAHGTAKFDLTLSLADTGTTIAGGLEYATALFDRATVERFVGYWGTLLEGMLDQEGVVDRLPLLNAEERHELVHARNAASDFTRAESLQELFEAQVERTPDAIALVYEQQTLTYAALNARANQLAHYLRARGVQRDDRVALALHRGLDMIAGILGVLKAGGAYVPLDPDSPPERIAHMLRDCEPVVVLTDDAWSEAAWSQQPVSNPEAVNQPNDLAYVIYTSGSTGVPKGVMVEHANVTRLLAATEEWYGFNEHDVWPLFHSYAFDVSVWEIWGALLYGGRLVIVPQQVTRAPEELYALVCSEGVTVLNQTPSAFRQFIPAQSDREHRLRLVILAGEALEVATLAPWFARNGERTRVVNMYGITETTVHSTYQPVTGEDALRGGSPIGCRIPDLRIYLLDEQCEPVPPGVAGELYVGGAGVARGYLNRPELTAQRFLRDPFAGTPGARMYRSGDLARYRSDGTLEFLGRNDFQVKIRGFRIELGEIEARLLEHPAVGEAVVLSRDERLVAYFVGENVAASELRAHLSASLPEYMIPAAYVRLERFPLTTNGKLDRKALPDADAGAFAVRAYAAPEGEIETIVARIWSELLGLDREELQGAGRHDNFFELGGHSLLAVTLVERMRRQGLHADVRSAFTTQTLAAFAAAATRDVRTIDVPPNLIPAGCGAITPAMLPLVDLSQEDVDRIVRGVDGGAANVQDIYPLAPLQEGILFHHLFAQDGDPYLISSLFAFDTRARLERYLAAVDEVIQRHDILRTAVVWEGLPQPVQVVWRNAPLRREEVPLDPAHDAAEQLRARFDGRRYRLDLHRAPLKRACIAYDAARQRWLLLLLTHHLVEDDVTLKLVVEEVAAHLLGKTGALSAPVPFRNFVAQARRGVSEEEHQQFFREMLGDVDEPTAPFGFLDVRGDGSGLNQATIELDAVLSGRIRERARRLGVNAASLCHLAWAQVLARVSGRDDVVFGTVLFGRTGGDGAGRTLGLFINTLPVRIRVDDGSVEESVRRTHVLLGDLLRHEHASLSLAQRCSAVPAAAPLFSALLNYRQSVRAARGRNAEAWAGIERLSSEIWTNYPLSLDVDDLGDLFLVTAQVHHSVDPMRICRLMETALTGLSDALEQAPATRAADIDVLPEAERRQVLELWNDTRADFPESSLAHELFEARVAKNPDAVALRFERCDVTYAELNARANQLAHQLRAMGVRPDDRVALCFARGIEMIVGLLAVLKAGGAYVPLDPAYPPARIEALIADCDAVVLLTQTGVALPSLSIPTLDLTANDVPWAGQPSGNPERIGDAGNLAYVIYTSGSTGLPKGVMIEHRGLCNQIAVLRACYDLRPADRILQFAAITFDMSVEEIFPALCTGAMLVIRTDAWLGSAREFWSLCEANGVSVVNLPTRFWQLLAEDRDAAVPQGIRLASIGGEGVDSRALEAWFARDGYRPRLFNAYGPTEATVNAAIREITAVRANWQSIGRPVANARVYLLDERGRPVPAGAVGELHISGAGVARGYLHRPELTAEKFVRDPFVSAPDARMYRSGDLARHLRDGSLEFLGRNDFQIKIRGFRIDPGEIEARLVALDGIREALVIAMEDSAGDRRLVAYLVGESPVDAEELRRRLAEQLPEFMIPAAYVRLDGIPLTAHGKLDRKALPAPGADAYATRAFEAPVGEVESIVAAIWIELLRLERVGRHDNFFELGGHSLLAITLMERMRRRGLQADVRAVFTNPTIAGLAASAAGAVAPVEVPSNRIPPHCSALTPDMLPLTRLTQAELDLVVGTVPGGARNVQDIYPLAPLQEGILFHHLLTSEGDPYLQIDIIRFDSRSRVDAYLAALQAVIDRHDILRSSVVWEGLRSAVQVVWREARLEVEELQLGGNVFDELRNRFGPRHYRIDVRRAPLLRACIAFDPANSCWLMALISHHLVGDHSTVEVMQSEIEAHLRGEAGALPAPLPFRNFVAQTRLGISDADHEAFFREMLAGADEPTAPFGLVEARGDGSDIEHAQARLDATLSRRLRESARRLGVSAATLCHLAWALVLARFSGRDDVIFGTVLFGRMQAGEGSDRVMGLFINTLPVRFRIDGQSAEASVRRTHVAMGDLLRHEHASLGLAQRCSAIAAPTPLFSSVFNFRYSAEVTQTPDAREAWSGIKNLYTEERSSYPLVLCVDDLGEGFGLTALVQRPIEPSRVCDFMATALERLLEALEHAPHMPLSALDVMPPRERRQLLDEWNATDAPVPGDVCIHELFEAHAAAVPAETAILQDGRGVTYGELNADANRLARHLRVLGVGPDRRVAICMERGPSIVTALLAVLKAGGGYVPLDPSYPAERLQAMLADSAPDVLLVHGAVDGAIAEAAQDLAIVDLAQPRAWSHQPADNLDRGALTPSHAAYIIYTSGSTGVPKGVVVEHRGVINLVYWQRDTFGVQPGRRVAQLFSYSFDGAVGETFMALGNGATLVMLDRRELEPQRLMHTINEQHINVGVFVPSLLKHLDPADLQHGDAVTIVSVGEACPKELALRWSAHCRFLNGYGPTEYTVYSHVWCATAENLAAHALVPIGAPIHNTKTYILDRELRPVPAGVIGEMYISGAGIARGYWNRPPVTDERFVVNPFCTERKVIEHGLLTIEGAEAEMKAFERDRLADPTHMPSAATITLEPSAVMRLVSPLDADTVEATRRFVDAYRLDDAIFDGFCRYMLEGANGSYASRGLNLEVLQRLLGIDDFAGLHGLDLGCGNGEVLETLAKAGARITGFDLSPFFVQRVLQRGLDARMAKVDVAPERLSDELHVEPGLQDFVLSTMLLDRVSRPRHYIANLFALLKPGGRFALQTILPVVPVDDGDVDEPITYTPLEHRIVPGVEAEEDKRALIQLLQRAGADEVHVRRLPYVIDSRDGVQRYMLWSFSGVKRARSEAIAYDRMYRTGDLGRYLADGSIEFVGRNDSQVKIRGFRIELGEIEVRLVEHPAVREAVVLAREDQPGQKRLVAYYVAAAVVDAAALRQSLESQLPEYMVPAAYVRMEALPLTPVGKIDRNALPPPDGEAYASSVYEAPADALEKLVAQVWAEVLELARVGRGDHFFKTGGDSLLAVRVTWRLRQALQVEVALTSLFSYPVLADFARELSKLTEPMLPPMTRAGDDERGVLSFEQQRLWLLAQLDGVSAAFHMQFAVRVLGSLDAVALRRALDDLVARHESLRTTFIAIDGVPRQRIAPPETSVFALREHDLRGHADADREFADLAAEEHGTPFDLQRGPLIRGRLVRRGDDDHTLFITQNHIVSDGWSTDVLLRELSALYGAYRAGRPNPLPPIGLHYADYAAWQRRTFAADALREPADYWRKTLAGAPALLDLPTDRERPAEQDLSGASFEFALDAQLTSAVRAFSGEHGTTMFVTMVASWAALLTRLSGQPEVVIGTPAENRDRAETEGIIGFFVNSLALRIDVAANPTVGELLEHVQARTLDAQRHQIPLEQVVEVVNPVRSLAHGPLFQVMLTWETALRGSLDLPGLAIAPVQRLEPGAAPTLFDLSLALVDKGETISCVVDYADALFDRSTVERYFRHWRTLLAAMVADPDAGHAAVDRLPLLTMEEQRAMVAQPDDLREPSRTLHGRFEAQVTRTPHAIAVIHEHRQVGYAELNARANRLARHLHTLGVTRDARVAVCAARGIDAIVALLAVLKAGGAYVPLDPGSPSGRLQTLLADCAPVAVLTQRAYASAIRRADDFPAVELDAESWSGQTASNLDLDVAPDALAYVIYTSGSTGTPKGVLIEHRAVCGQLDAIADLWDLTERDRVLQFAPLTFDVSVEEIFSALLSGAALVLRTDAWVATPREFWQHCREAGVTHIDVPSRFWQLLAKDDEPIPASVRKVFTGGELGDDAAFAAWLARDGHPQLFHCYGPTEATINATVYQPVPGNSSARVIGRPLAGTRIYLLDAHRQPVPLGVAGELWIGGDCLARGYLHRPELTAERFLRDPFVSDTAARMYRSGDLARRRADGTLEFLGRNDDQIKIRGFRVELGEIEARLAEHPHVAEAAVAAIDEGGDTRLIAYVVPASAFDGAELRRHLEALLPDFMIPASYVRLDALPLTPSGKLDRKALPSPDRATPAVRTVEAPMGEIEMVVAQIWAELLHLDRVSRGDHFFDLGGHSLVAIQVLSRIRQRLGIEVHRNALFAHPVLHEFAREIAASVRSTPPAILPAGGDDRSALSFAQQRLWFLSQMDGAGAIYFMPYGVRLLGALDTGALRRALDRLVARHESLRTTFIAVAGIPRQRIAAADASHFALAEDDLRGHANGDAEVARIAEEETRLPFDLEHGPLIRGRLLQQGDEDFTLLITQHHIISDGWSTGVLLSELSALYTAFVEARPDPLQPLTLQYADYGAWQRRWMSGDRMREQAGYWATAMKDAPALLELPADHARPAKQNHQGSTVPVQLDESLSRALRALSQRHGTTLFMTMLASWAALLSRLSGQCDLVIGTPSANRERAEIEGLVGFFVNTLALRIDLSGSPSVTELLGRVKVRALAAQQHQDIPFEQVVELVRPARSLAHSPLFQVLFAWGDAADEPLALPGLTVMPGAPVPNTTAKFDLSLSLGEAGETITGVIEYATSLFERDTIERYLGSWRTLLEAMAANDEQAVETLPLLTAEEQQQLLQGWNGTSTDYRAESCLQALFEEQVTKNAEAVAIVQGARALTYAELNSRANACAHTLQVCGVGIGDRVAILLDRSIELVVAELAIVKCGAAYVPLDPTFPQERLAFLMADSGAKAVIADREVCFEGVTRLDVYADGSIENLGVSVDSASLAYVMYTSGSTGQPKGVMVPHGAVQRLVLNNGYAELRAGDRVALSSNPAFDATTFEVWAPLLNGCAIVVIERNALLDPRRFREALLDHGVTVLWMTVGLFNQYVQSGELEDAFAALRYLIVGGDALDATVIARVLRGRAPQHLVNGYGPTESTTFAITHEIREVAPGARSIPIGRPIANTRVYLLDERMEPVPIGMAGEIYIGGAGVALGYLNRPELTRERFLADPFAADGARMYKTGDLARRRADGVIEFLGRNDAQVKIRGFRVEPGEIEARLLECPGVREAVVVGRQEHGERHLIAYVVGDEVDAHSLLSHLSERLPEFMLPFAFVVLEHLPLTANGKVDRNALPAPDADTSAAYEAPVGPIESAIAKIWTTLLRIERVGRRDDFFAIGGHSLLAVQLISRLRQVFSVEVALTTLFARPVLMDLAQSVADAARTTLPPVTPVDGEERLALSFAQQRLWFLSQLDGADAVYNVPFGLRLIGALDRDALRASFDALVARHEALRTTFTQLDGQPRQRIAADGIFTLIEHDLSNVEDAGTELERLRSEEAGAPFDLEQGPLFRGRLVRLREDEHALFLTLHHIVADGWSIGVLLREWAALYNSEELPPLVVQYADYAAWQRRWIAGDVLQQQAAFWTRTLREAPAQLDLPTDRPRPVQQDHAGASFDVFFDADLSSGIRDLSQRHGTTLFMTLLASWAVILARLSGQDEVVIGAPTANRGRAEVEGLIGFFVNTLALRVDLSDAPTVAQLQARVREQVLAAQQNQDIPFEKVVELVRPERSLGRNPLFQTTVSWHHASAEPLHLAGLSVLPDSGEVPMQAKFDLALSLGDAGGQIAGGIEYATALFDRTTIERFVRCWRTLLAEMVADDARRVTELPLLDADERRLLLEEWSGSVADYPRERCIHELFETQAALAPDAIAIVDGERTLTYRQLDRQANGLARLLIARGVMPGDRVATLLDRSAELIVAELAILKCGAAYVPLDRQAPQERRAFMLEDCGVRVVVSERELEDAIAWNDEKPEISIDPEAPAYVMYTSGSTGRPKGVVIPHRAIARLVIGNGVTPFDANDRVAFTANPGFDASAFEMWGPLLHGARVVIIPQQVLLDPDALAQTLRREQVTVLQLVAGLLSASAEPLADVFPLLRYLVTGGDIADPRTFARVLRNPPQHLIQTYGPTETTTFVTAWDVTVTDGVQRIPIGRPLANTRIYILDAAGQPVPVGVVGEIHIGGDGIAHGYWNRPGLTAEKFVIDPFSPVHGARMYRSGDRARWLPDGNIDFLGRVDQQVKIRGIRIEPAEIEARLAEDPAVRDAVVIARGGRLVAYVVADGDLDVDALRRSLAARLPEVMVPAAFVLMETWPLTANGKLDRNALPEPESASGEYEAPQGEIEIVLASIWAELLGTGPIGRNANFFELGGHSLLAVTLLERMRRHGLRAEVRAVFTASTLAGLAALAEHDGALEIPPNLIPQPLSYDPDSPAVVMTL